MKNEIAETKKPKLVEKFADKFGVDKGQLLETLKQTCFQSNKPISNQEMMALLVVADQYGLNPFTREIFAFPDKNKGIVPVVGVDGWSRIINNHKALDGLEFRYSETMTTPQEAQECPEWCEVVIYRKDRAHPTVVREYIDEVYRKPFKQGMSGPWQTHTKRFLRHKVLIQGARLAFGFGGIFDEDEAQGIIDITPSPEAPPRPKKEDFEPGASEAVELIPFSDAYGEKVGNYSVSDFVEAMIDGIEGADSRELLDEFMGNNDDAVAALGTRTDTRKEIAEAFNMACENFGAEETKEPESEDGEKKWAEWCAEFSGLVDDAKDVPGLNALLGFKQTDFDNLLKQFPKWHADLLDRINKKKAGLEASP